MGLELGVQGREMRPEVRQGLRCQGEDIILRAMGATEGGRMGGMGELGGWTDRWMTLKAGGWSGAKAQAAAPRPPLT